MADHVNTSQIPRKIKANRHCCVPLCTADSRYDSTLNFHKIPQNETMKKQWIIKIRRDEGPMFTVSLFILFCYFQAWYTFVQQ